MAECKKEVFILDTSALLAYIEDEDGTEYAEDLLIKAEGNEITIYINLKNCHLPSTSINCHINRSKAKREISNSG